MKNNNFIRLPIQYFGEPQGSVPAGDENTPVIPNYEELIKTDKSLQSFLDSRVQSATSTAVQKAIEKQRILSDEKATEAEKLAKMNKEEKQAYELEKYKKQIVQFEAKENARQLKDEALKLATEKNIPHSLVGIIPFESIKAEDVQIHIDNIKAVYDKAVADGIAQALDGAGTPKGVGTAETKTSSVSSFMKTIAENQAKRN